MWEAIGPSAANMSLLSFYTSVVLLIYGVLGAFIWLKPLEAAKKPYLTWAIMIPLLLVPLWLGPVAWTIAVLLIAIYGFKEFTKGTGLYEHKTYVAVAYVFMLLMAMAVIGRDYGMFMALPVWGVATLTTLPVFTNRYEGSIQNLSLSIIGLVYFGWFLLHLAYLYQYEHGPGYVLFVLIFTQFNDAQAFLWGKLFGKRQWTRLSPKKTIEGSLLAMAGTIAIAFLNWPVAFPHFEWWLVALAGFAVSFGGQMGDLVMSAFKRDLGIKDFGSLLPGHGGILDRIDSLVWVAPTFFHMARYFHQGFGH